VCLTEKDCLKKYDIRIVIISRSRANTIKSKTLKYFPDWIEVIVPESQKETYQKVISNPILTTPDDIKGLGLLRNWVLDHLKEKTVVMVDDDITSVYSLTGPLTRRIEDPLEVVQLIINTTVMAQDLGVSCFGFSQLDIRKYKGTDPFILNTWVGCIIGIIGRRYRFRQDKFKVDIDFCLKNLLVDRILFCDSRYYFAQNRDNNTGGNSEYRTEETMYESINSLVDKWFPYVSSNKKKHRNNVSIKLNVARRQSISYE